MNYLIQRKADLEKSKAQALQNVDTARLAVARVEGAQIFLEALLQQMRVADAVVNICKPKGEK